MINIRSLEVVGCRGGGVGGGSGGDGVGINLSKNLIN